jgi:NAD(P) transhydrogenase subunit alpha
LLDAIAKRGLSALAMDAVPRITRAQKMDALSSMANIAGYRAIVEAAHAFPRPFAGQITAAGKTPPAKVLVIGAGVAGLAAIGAARSLGAVVRAFDTRAAVKEQVQSMGAEFLELDLPPEKAESGEGQGGYAKEMSKAFLDAEMALFLAQAKDVDIIVTTALIPGKPAPKLITEEMVRAMRRGSVVVDLAAEQGGNCALTVPHERADVEGVAVLGYTDLASRMAAQASQLYGTNLYHLLDDMTAKKDGARAFRIDFEDEVVRAATVVKDGQITWPPPKRDAPVTAKPTTPTYPADGQGKSAASNGLPAGAPPGSLVPSSARSPAPTTQNTQSLSKPRPKTPSASHAPVGLPGNVPLLLAGLALVGVGVAAPPAFLSHLIVFVLACFVGYQVIWNVAPALHTPLMSVTNAVSGIILIGGLLHASDGFDRAPAATVLGALAILVATINVAGGFLVTQRMLKMFRRGDR